MAKGDVIQDKDLIERIDKALASEDTASEELYWLAGEAYEKCILSGEIRRYNSMFSPKGILWTSPEARKRSIAVSGLQHPIWEYTRKDFFYSNEEYYINEFRPVLAEFSKSTKHLWALGEEASNALRPKEKLESGYTMFMADWSEEKIKKWEEDDLRKMYEDTFCENPDVVEKIIAEWKEKGTPGNLFHERYLEYMKQPHKKASSEKQTDKNSKEQFYDEFHRYMQELDAHPEMIDSPHQSFPSPQNDKPRKKFPFGIFKLKK